MYKFSRWDLLEISLVAIVGAFVLMVFAGCCANKAAFRGVNVPAPTAPSPAPVLPHSGLICTLYTVPSGTPSIAGAHLTKVTSFVYIGEINQPNVNASLGLNILPNPYRNTYQTWFILRCKGLLKVDVKGNYPFELSSDDGSRLYLDGKLVIDNDGNHAMLSKTGHKKLKVGMHSIRLDYMQGPATNLGLVLSSSNVVIPTAQYWHK